jgi:hypothetical protein
VSYRSYRTYKSITNQTGPAPNGKLQASPYPLAEVASTELAEVASTELAEVLVATFSRSALSAMNPLASDWLYACDGSASIVAIAGL